MTWCIGTEILTSGFQTIDPAKEILTLSSTSQIDVSQLGTSLPTDSPGEFLSYDSTNTTDYCISVCVLRVATDGHFSAA